MPEEPPPIKIRERAAIVRIAYYQASLMIDVKESKEPPKSENIEPPVNDDVAWLTLPSTLLSSVHDIGDKYKTLTNSSESLGWFLENTRNHITEGFRYIAPIPGMIVAAIEPQLKSVGDALRARQNFLGEAVPSVTDVKEYFRSALVTAIYWLDAALGALRHRLAIISSSIEGGSKDSTKPKKEPNAK